MSLTAVAVSGLMAVFNGITFSEALKEKNKALAIAAGTATLGMIGLSCAEASTLADNQESHIQISCEADCVDLSLN